MVVGFYCWFVCFFCCIFGLFLGVYVCVLVGGLVLEFCGLWFGGVGGVEFFVVWYFGIVVCVGGGLCGVFECDGCVGWCYW